MIFKSNVNRFGEHLCVYASDAFAVIVDNYCDGIKECASLFRRMAHQQDRILSIVRGLGFVVAAWVS
jgi:hypothetical protein